MALALTSSIFNLKKGPLHWGLLFLLSCSTPKKEVNKTQSLATTPASKVEYGPTQPGGGFVDKTSSYGLEDLFAVSFNAVDLNFDGFTDLIILPTYYSRPRFFIFHPKEKKFKLWENDPIPVDFKASFLVVADLNRDRIPDIVSAVLNQRSEVTKVPLQVYLGAIKKGLLNFVLSKDAIKLPADPTSGLSLIDYDLDGHIDLFVGNWYENRSGQHIPVADRFLKNVNGKFLELPLVLRNESYKTPSQLYPPNARPTYGSSTCDIDQNGFPDILTVSSSGYKNKLWMNLNEPTTKERHFEDLGNETGYASDSQGSLIPTGGGRGFFSACSDYNDDGLMDIFLGVLSHAYDNESVDKSSILTGSKETFPPFFLRTEYVSDANSESWNQGDRRAIWFDYNLDGHLDLLVDNSGFPPFSRLVLFEQDKDHGFQNVASQRGVDVVNPTGSIVIDINRDGRPDIITSQNSIREATIAPRLFVFENQVPRKGNRSIRVHLGSHKSNTDVFGAMVMLLTTEGKKRVIQRRWTETVQGGLASQNESGSIFGIKSGISVNGIKVRWPTLSGKGILERLYSLDKFKFKEHLEVTACEDGRILAGKLSCVH